MFLISLVARVYYRHNNFLGVATSEDHYVVDTNHIGVMTSFEYSMSRNKSKTRGSSVDYGSTRDRQETEEVTTQPNGRSENDFQDTKLVDTENDIILQCDLDK